MIAATKYTMPHIDDIAKWCHGEWLQQSNSSTIEELTIDTRKIAQPSIALFVALATSNRDGHTFIPTAYEKGVRNFLVAKDIDTADFAEANIIKVKDTLAALQLIAAHHRRQFSIPCIGITGSNGKTIVKEWLYQLLVDDYKTVRSPKSYNSQIGVPLSVFLMREHHELAIFEAGISQPAEMECLEKIVRPNIGVFTNIGEAHSEGFLNDRQKINEKLVLFRNVNQLVYCKDYQELNQCVVKYASQRKSSDGDGMRLFTWSQKHEADLRITQISKNNNQTQITAIYNNEEISIDIPFADYASIENAIHCWCVLLLLNTPQPVIQDRMQYLSPVSMRLELRHGINDCTIINDTYNSDLTSLLIAIEYLEQQKQHQHHTLIMSDILQIARPDSEIYEEVADILSQKHIQRFIGIGPVLYKHKAVFRKHKKIRSIFFKTTDDFLKNFHLITFNKEAVLLKGARTFTFERIGKLLEQKIHQTVLSINLSSLSHNLAVYRKLLKPHTKTMAMVKAFSYGSGSYEIANRLQYAGVDYLAVAYTEEGISLRKAGITLPIMVMSPDNQSFDRMIAWKLEPEIYSIESLSSFCDIAATLQVEKHPIHIKLDTGMHRLGFMQEEIKELVDYLANNDLVEIQSVFTHLAASEDKSLDDFTAKQLAVYDEMYKELSAALNISPIRHVCNSAGIVRHPQYHYDMVRLGIGLYGIDSSGMIQSKLQQIGTLKSTIAQIKKIPAGDGLGYGHTDISDKERIIATINIGYADGYPRHLKKNNPYFLIHGEKAYINGSICMDLCMVDITHIPQARERDEVIIFGEELSVLKLAEWAGTIPYEIMTGISQRVKRVYENEA